MLSKKKLLRNSNLYLILDREVNDYDRLFEILKRSVRSGVDIVQLRDKQGSSRDILRFAQRATSFLRGKVPFIVNDRADLALAVRAQGVHLGQEDLPIFEARRIMGPKAIIGASCQTWAHARKAQEEGADYIGFGSVFKTMTKPTRNPMDLKLLARISSSIKIPVFAIGGIDTENVHKVLETGISRVAVCRSVCKAEDIQKEIQILRKSLKSL